MIWRPNFGDEFGTKDFFLQLNLTTEKIDFTDITGPTGIANRGFFQKGIFLGGLGYLQAVNDSFDNTGQHFEPGFWANIPATAIPNEKPSVVRMASIPHGTTINAQGFGLTAPQPLINPTTITPFAIGSPDDGVTGLVHFPEEQLAIPSTSRTDLSRVASLTQAHLSNPNLFLTEVVAQQTILSTVVLIISSDTSVPGSVPDAGGGIDNIAFLQGSGAPPAGNANAPKMTAIFWIEEVKNPDGSTFLQLQYTQRVLLNFGGLTWPHVSVATLTIAPPAPAC